MTVRVRCAAAALLVAALLAGCGSGSNGAKRVDSGVGAPSAPGSGATHGTTGGATTACQLLQPVDFETDGITATVTSLGDASSQFDISATLTSTACNYELRTPGDTITMFAVVGTDAGPQDFTQAVSTPPNVPGLGDMANYSQTADQLSPKTEQDTLFVLSGSDLIELSTPDSPMVTKAQLIGLARAVIARL